MTHIRSLGSSIVVSLLCRSILKAGAGALAFSLALCLPNFVCRAQDVANTNTVANPASNTPPTVELTPAQTNEIKIEPVGSYLFPVEKSAVGSITFDEDPTIVQAESTLVGAAATFDLTRKELARVQSLGESNGIAPKEIEQATSDAQTADAALKAASDALRALGVTDGEINHMIATGKMRGTGVSPVSSTGSHAWLLANIVETDSPLLHLDQPLKATVEALPGRVFEGKVSRIYGIVDPNTHRVSVRSEIDDPQNELRPGMLANVVIQVADPIQAAAIPVKGVVREADGAMTGWVTTDRHKFTQRNLKLGLQTDGRYQVLEGLEPGELAVTEGAVFLSNILNAPPSDD